MDEAKETGNTNENIKKQENVVNRDDHDKLPEPKVDDEAQHSKSTETVTHISEVQTTNELSPSEVQLTNTTDESSQPTTSSLETSIDSDENKGTTTTHDTNIQPLVDTEIPDGSNTHDHSIDQTIPSSPQIQKDKLKSTENVTHISDEPEVQTTNTTNVQPTTSSLETSTKDKETPTTSTHDTNIKPLVDAPESITGEIPDANASNTHNHSIDETIPSSPKFQKDIVPAASSDSQTNPYNKSTDRTHLLNLITQELSFVGNICPKLGKHQHRIKKEAEDASKLFEKLKDEPCDLKELKDLRKTVTKLKLQIPAKYRTYDESDEQKNHHSDEENRGVVSHKLLRKMPRLLCKIFNESPFCKIIQQNYDTLKRETKLCLLCFSVFPENVVISRRLMIYWWIGERLILPDETTSEDCANDIFNELIEKDFIQPVSKSHGRYVATCKMHPMVRAALVMIADNINFFDFDEYGNPKDFGKFDDIESPQDVPGNYPLGDPREFFDFFDEKKSITSNSIEFVDSQGNPIQFAALQHNDLVPSDRDGCPIDTNKKHYYYRKKKITTRSFKVCLMGSGLSKGISWEKLHMLFNVRDDILEFKPEWFIRMKNVNILVLGRWQSSDAHHIEVEEFNFEKSMEHLNHVRFFSLQGVSRISELPNSISKLESLVILDLRACHNLEVIPKTIGSLKLLTHLDMSGCYLLKDIPKEISSLESLQVLKGFIVVDSPGRHVCTLQDLKKLENLRKLSMYTQMKHFPAEVHLEALQKFERLRKLTILWGGHESNPQTPKPNQNGENEKKEKLTSKVTKLFPKKQWVKGSIRRMNAFINSTLGSRLEKLDLKCFPSSVTPNWLTPGSLSGLKKLYIRGGQFSDLGQYQDTLQWDDLPKDTWNVEILRLKYLDELKMEWRELHSLFPKMISLEKVKCPRLTLFPCNEQGVWIQKTT